MSEETIMPAGLILQPYRAKIPGDEAAKVAAFSAKIDTLTTEKEALAGLAPHGFTTEFSPAEWVLWRNEATRRGLQPCVAFGLNDADPEGKGERMAEVCKEGASACVLNDESAWDQSDDAAKVALMCAPIAKDAPKTLMLEQSWPVPTVHAAHPYEEFNRWCVALCEERYYNDFKSEYGDNRVAMLEARSDQSWGSVEFSRLAPKGLVRPHWPTFQGYAYDSEKVLYEFIGILCKYDSVPVFIWCEWWPQPSFWLAVRCLVALHKAGYFGPSAVWRFQHDHGLTVDGKCGPRTRAVLGVS